MFRWVAMSLQSLQQIKYLPDFKKALGRLPSDLSDLYEIIYIEIAQDQPYGRDVAIRTLKWLLCAQRLLTIPELTAATMVHEITGGSLSDSDEDEWESEQAQLPENDIVRLCRNLVVIDSEKGVFRFAHQSVREYLLTRQEYIVMEQHACVTMRCLDVYLDESLSTSSKLNIGRHNDILEPYARLFWPVHHNHADDYDSHEFKAKISQFLKQDSRAFSPYLRWVSSLRSDVIVDKLRRCELFASLEVDRSDPLNKRLLFALFEPPTPLATACAFGLLSFLKDHALSSTDWNQRLERAGTSYTGLFIAAQEGHEAVVPFLLECKVDANAQGGHYGNALAAASYFGHNQVVQMLLERDADVNTQGGHYGNALQTASRGGHIQTVQMLIEKDADVNAQGGLYGNALQAACWSGYNHIVQILLERDADVNAQGGQCGSALVAASWGGDNQVVQLLMDKGANVNAQSSEYGTPLHMASKDGHDLVAQLLLENGANVNAQSSELGTPLHMASENGHDLVVQMLLENGADISAQDENGGTALHVASKFGEPGTVQVLLRNGAEISAQDGDGNTALQVVSGLRRTTDRDRVVQILRESGAQ